MTNHPRLKKLYQQGPRFLRSSRKRNFAALLSMNELLYERMFANALIHFDLGNHYYPVKSAATYSLLYLILRAVTELPVQRILELGAGQSTLLLDALQRRRNIEVITLEHDRSWAERLQCRVSHRIQHVPLIDKTIHGHTTSTYDLSACETTGEFDLLIVDGPIGKRRKSRWGTLDIVDQFLGRDFAIIFDDAQRKGELDTIERLMILLDSRGRSPSIGITESVTSQCVIADGRYAEAAYF